VKAESIGGLRWLARADFVAFSVEEATGMARAYSEDLRRRVMVAIAGGLSTRAAARRFEIGESTAGAWHRLWRASGDCRARKQGHPPGSKLDAHAAFMLALTEASKDISLAEIAARLRTERGVSACAATVWHFFDKRGITYKKRPPTRPNRSARM
jgi:transposase